MVMGWRPYYAGETAETIIKRQINDGDLFPFNNILIRNDYDWDAIGSLRLYGKDALQRFAGQKGGAVKLEAGDNWKITIKLTTTDGGYFEDNITGAGVDVEGGQWGSSYATFTLDGRNNDFLSLDLNSQHSGIGVFTLKVNGYIVSKDNPQQFGGDDVFLQIEKVEHYEELEPDNPQDTFPSDEKLQEEQIQDLEEERREPETAIDVPECKAGYRYDATVGACVVDETIAPDWSDYVLIVGTFAIVLLAVGVIKWRGQ